MDATTQRLMMGAVRRVTGGSYLGAAFSDSPGIFLLDHTSAGALSLAYSYNLGTSSPDIDFSPDGEYAVVTSPDIASLTLLSRTSPGAFSYVTKYDNSDNFGPSGRASFSPDGNYVVATNRYTSSAAAFSPSLVLLHRPTPTTFSYADGELAMLFAGQRALNAVFSPDGNYVAVKFNQSPYLNLYDHTTPGSLTLAATYTLAETGSIQPGLRFSPDGNYLAVSASVSPYFVLLDHTTPGSLSLATTYDVSHNGGINIRFSPDGNYIAVVGGGNPNGLTLLNHTTPGSVSLSATYTFTDNATADSVAFTPDGRYVAVGVTIVNPGNPIVTLLDHTTAGSLSLAATYSGQFTPSVRGLAFTPD